MYVDGYLLFAIYFIAVLALAVSAYALWTLEEIRQYYAKKSLIHKDRPTTQPVVKVPRAKGHWD